MTATDELDPDRDARGRLILPFPYNLLITTMPKAGTHFLSRMVEDVLRRPALPLRKSNLAQVESLNVLAEELGVRSFLFFGHFRYQHYQHLFGPHWRFLTLIRDPRDVVLSMRDHLARSTTKEHRAFFETIEHLSVDEQLKILIEGGTRAGYEVAPIRKHCGGWVDWERRRALCLRFETLNEPASTAALAEWLGVDPSAVDAAASRFHKRPTSTFNFGNKDRWRTDMSDEVLGFFRERSQGIVEKLGYDW